MLGREIFITFNTERAGPRRDEHDFGHLVSFRRYSLSMS